jgi:hypothetical protein
MGLSIQKHATEAEDGTYLVKTQGLDAHRRAELEIVGIPRSAVEPAAKLIDYVIETVIERRGAQLKASENVGIPLSVGGHEEIRAIFVGVHARQSEPPSGGFFAKMRGAGGKGVLRLIDLPGAHDGPPFAALAAMMLYRANCRLVMGDVAGAITELRESIKMMPGDTSAGPPPAFDAAGDAEMNWENHLSYLRLAELVEPPEAASIYREVFSRFAWLAQRDMGCGPADLGGLVEAALVVEATRIIAQNLAEPGIVAGPHAGLRFVASPLWMPRDDGTSARQASLIPAGFVGYYFGGHLAAPEAADALARLAAQCLLRYSSEPWKVSFMTTGAREMYNGTGAPGLPLQGVGPRHAAHFLLSAVIAEAARYLHAGATLDELRVAFGLGGGGPEVPATLASKLGALEAWETQQYTSGLFSPS